eukprot:UN08846
MLKQKALKQRTTTKQTSKLHKVPKIKKRVAVRKPHAISTPGYTSDFTIFDIQQRAFAPPKTGRSQ